MKLIDIHNHVLPQIDDGSKSVEISMNMLELAAKDGIQKLIVTPHFKEEILENTKEIIKEKVGEIQKLVNQLGLDLEIYPGCEIFLSKNSTSLLQNQKIQTLNDSSYILVETHRIQSLALLDLKEELYNLSVDGYKVILAHPERYEFTHKDTNYIYELVQAGHLMQINVNSLRPNHPNHKVVKKLLDHNLVHFIASDAHDVTHRPLKLREGYEMIKKHYGEKKADQIFYHHPMKVIQNLEIEINDFKEIKDKKFFFFKRK